MARLGEFQMNERSAARWDGHCLDIVQVAGVLLRMATSVGPSTPGGAASVASRAAMARAIRIPLLRLGPRGANHHIFAGQRVQSIGGGFATRWGTYATVVSQRGRILYWGDGLASWDGGQSRPDVNLSVYPVGQAGSLYRLLSRPSGSIVRYTPGASPPTDGVTWYELLIPGHRVMFAVDPQRGVWIFEGGPSGRLSQVMGPPTFSHSR